MPNFYPDPELPPNPVNPEVDEVLLEVEALMLPRSLRNVLEDSIHFDDEVRKLATRRPDTALNMESLMWVRRVPIDDENVPMPYKQLLWRPDYASLAERRELQHRGRRPLADTVSAILVRLPTVTQELLEFYGAEDDRRIILNDIFIEVAHPDGDSTRYLYNSKGITPYENNDSLEEIAYDVSRLEPNADDEAGPYVELDMYRVVVPHPDPNVRQLTPAKLLTMLKESPQRQQRPRTLE
jgi:hypothetical protein